MVSQVKNCFLVNAPAGSGKTTKIKSMVQKFIDADPQNNVLCITYTNRAADELAKGFNTKNLFVGTIHSFLHHFMKQYFTHKDILNLYFDVYGQKIQKRIDNLDKNEHIEESNHRYKEKYGHLNYDIIRQNITSIFYNESPFSTLYYGGLSHDDLISFSKCIFDRYPVIRKRISAKYQFIFIDEYQDTMADVLAIFYESVVRSKSQLYLFGDRMQQIYKNYDGSFEDKFDLFDSTIALSTNYRSVTPIVNILNKIYNDPSFIQDNSLFMKEVKSDFSPRIVVKQNVSSYIEAVRSQNSDTLVLYLLNKERFADIGAHHLYHAFNSMEKYSFGKSYSATTVLTTLYNDNPDPLLKLLYCIVDMAKKHQNQQYGLIIQTLKLNKAIFCKESWYIQKHTDKQKLFNNLKEIFSVFEDETKTIFDLLNVLTTTSLVESSYMEGIQSDEENKVAFDVPAIELKRVIDYLNNPKVSTQHGVKGESHNSVLFIADDSSINPVVHMYRFLEMWGEFPISLKSFNHFYYDYMNELADLQKKIGIKINDLNKQSYSKHKELIGDKIIAIANRFEGNLYFEFLYKETYRLYIARPGVSKAKECLKENTVLGVLNAYKLFYVGCSRARQNLTILLDKSKIKGDFKLQKTRFIEIGFTVQ